MESAFPAAGPSDLERAKVPDAAVLVTHPGQIFAQIFVLGVSGFCILLAFFLAWKENSERKKFLIDPIAYVGAQVHVTIVPQAIGSGFWRRVSAVSVQLKQRLARDLTMSQVTSRLNGYSFFFLWIQSFYLFSQ